MSAPIDETPYTREPGYAVRYRDARFATGTGRGTHDREARAIRELLTMARAASGQSTDAAAERAATPSSWLDLPSGAGRLSELLPGPVVRVDKDPAMLIAAGDGLPRVCARAGQLPFCDAAFAGALTMRLLHHLRHSDERIAILRELRRVTDGPLIVSFFHAINLQHARRVVSRWFGRRNTGRSAVTWRQFRADLRAAGWQPIAARPLRRFVSEQWIVLAR